MIFLKFVVYLFIVAFSVWSLIGLYQLMDDKHKGRE